MWYGFIYWHFITLPLTRYALQLLTPAALAAGFAGRKEITLEDIAEMRELFLDAKSSASKISGEGNLQ
jgi:RuvB-like protein 1 (pontin 52)